MKKAKVALQFVSEIFIVTFIALIIGTSVGAAVSVPVTNTLLQNQIQSSQSSSDNARENFGFKNDDKPDMPNGGPMGDMFTQSKAQNYVDNVNSATNLAVIIELVLVGLFLTILASLAALISIMRYEPLKILSNRS